MIREIGFAINMCTTKQSLLQKILKCNAFYGIGGNCRNYSNSYNAMPLLKNTLEEQEFEKYKSHVHYIIQYLTTAEKELTKEGRQYLKNILSSNLPSHIQDTGPLVVSTYKHFAPLKKQTQENMKMVYTVGWAYDMIIRGYQIMDDLIDSSETRDNKPCWHRQENIGLKAVNDSVVVIEAGYLLIKNYLRGHPGYFSILELTNETKLKIVLGQMLDVNCNFEQFTMERWNILAKYKGTFGGVIDPVVRGLFLAEVFDKKLHNAVRNVLIELGEYFTAQNDMLDCYGKSTITGKYGNDISEGKLTWLAVRALADANSTQRELFQKRYGKPDQESQKMIKDMYDELNIFKKFLMYEEKCYKNLYNKIEKLPKAIPKEFMYSVIDAYYGKV